MGKFNRAKSFGGGVVLSPLIVDETTEGLLEILPPAGEPLVQWTVSTAEWPHEVEMCDASLRWHCGPLFGTITTPALGDYPSRTINVGFHHSIEPPYELVITLYGSTIVVEKVDDDGVAEELAVVGVSEALVRWICRWWRNKLEEWTANGSTTSD